MNYSQVSITMPLKFIMLGNSGLFFYLYFAILETTFFLNTISRALPIHVYLMQERLDRIIRELITPND